MSGDGIVQGVFDVNVCVPSEKDMKRVLVPADRAQLRQYAWSPGFEKWRPIDATATRLVSNDSSGVRGVSDRRSVGLEESNSKSYSFVLFVRGEATGPAAKQGYAVLDRKIANERMVAEEAARQQRIEAEAQRKYAQEQSRKEDVFNALLRSANPRQMYLSAVQFEDTGEKGRAKTVYRELLKRHSSSQEALLASQRLMQLSDVEAVQASNNRAAYEVQNQNFKQCQSDRNACFARCSNVKGSSAQSTCQNGCAICQQ